MKHKTQWFWFQALDKKGKNLPVLEQLKTNRLQTTDNDTDCRTAEGVAWSSDGFSCGGGVTDSANQKHEG
jgi:hypothetical protein